MTSKAVTLRKGKTGPVTITEAGLTLVRKLAADGVAISTIAKALRVNPSTFRKMRKEDEALADAVETGRAKMETELVGILMAAARKGQIVPALFLLKTMRGFVEGKPPEGAGGPLVNITIPAAMTPAEFAKVIDIEPAPDPGPVPDQSQKVIRS